MKPGQGFRFDHERPILLLDVDGVLNCSGESPWPDAKTTWPQVRHEWGASRCRVTTSPRIGDALLSLDVEIRWLTTWGHDANRRISPRAGLPQRLPVAGVPVESDHGKMRWKVDVVVDTVKLGRFVIWVDDDAERQLEDEIRSRAAGAELLVLRTDPQTGLTPDEVEHLRVRLTQRRSRAT